MLKKLIWLRRRKNLAQELTFDEETRIIDNQPYHIVPLNPEEITDQYEAINNYIQQKAEIDLPPSQFHKNIDQLSLEECIEIGGIIGVGKTIKETREMLYYPPGNAQVGMRIKFSSAYPFIRLRFYSKTGMPINVYFEKNNFQYYLDWHSHPGLGRKLSNKDLLAFTKLKAKTPNLFGILYLPLTQEFFWYDIKAKDLNSNGIL